MWFQKMSFQNEDGARGVVMSEIGGKNVTGDIWWRRGPSKESKEILVRRKRYMMIVI